MRERREGGRERREKGGYKVQMRKREEKREEKRGRGKESDR